MSAAVCGSKRSFFEDLPPSPPLSKRLRCSSSTSPVRLSPPSLIDHLRAVFPRMEVQVLERALQECGYDIDAAIKSLHELCLSLSDEALTAFEKHEGKSTDDLDASTSENKMASSNLPVDGAEWVDLLVREMSSATSFDDAKARAARILEVLEKSISERASAEATNVIKNENMVLKEQIEQLKLTVSQYQEQLRTLEVNNYALAMHLKQAQQVNSFPGRFPPDVY
ncbi:uncharacterized protein G2W53_000157 [Senna tora]|uniref:CUE domain-containing protein n=1 Tax=Senna tora TaxID=362788 RepID=A0A834XDX2_9FABA|nr:uncharacterized protein G2W53_000157 [Senna tora]